MCYEVRGVEWPPEKNKGNNEYWPPKEWLECVETEIYKKYSKDDSHHDFKTRYTNVIRGDTEPLGCDGTYQRLMKDDNSDWDYLNMPR